MDIVRASKWIRRSGMLPSRAVLRHRKSDDTYITHIQLKNPKGNLSYILGHYDMSYKQGLADFNKRAKSLGSALG